MASGQLRAGEKARSVATIERRLSALAWNFTQRGLPFDRNDRHIATVLAGVRRTHGRPPKGKEALLSQHVRAMLEALPPSNLRNIRDRAILLLGFAGGLRRSEIVGLDCRAEDSREGSGWPEFQPGGLLLTLRGKTGWREVEIGYGSSEATCPVVALKAWMNFAHIAHGPLFRRVVGREIAAERLNGRHVARLVKRLAMACGLRGDLSEDDREQKFSAHSLRAGLASSADIDERYVQNQLGHASAEMTRRY
jgi:integrase